MPLPSDTPSLTRTHLLILPINWGQSIEYMSQWGLFSNHHCVYVRACVDGSTGDRAQGLMHAKHMPYR